MQPLIGFDFTHNLAYNCVLSMSSETRDFSRYRIVEVGPFDKPMVLASQEVQSKFHLGAAYIALDPFPTHIAPAAGSIPNLYFVEGKLQALPLRREIADELWVFNVFGFGDGTLRENEARFDDGGNILQLLGRPHDFLSELRRVVKPGGVVYIGETSGTSAKWLKDFDMNAYSFEKKLYWGTDEVLAFFDEHRIDNKFSIDPVSFSLLYGANSLVLELTKRAQV